MMESRNEILVYGNISDSEIKELSESIPESEVIKVQTKGLSPADYVQLVFHDFTLLSYTRDFILSALLGLSLTQVKKAVKYLRNRNKVVKTASIEVQIKTKSLEFLLTLTSPPDKLDLLLELSNDKIDIIVEDAENGSLMQVTIKEGENSIVINKI
jgi:hypothetical protein